MKKLFVILSLGCIVAACGNQSNEKKETTSAPATTETAPATTNTQSADVAKGGDLIAKSDCLTCHRVSEKIVGPPYEAVAAKYTATEEVIDTLSEKIIKGGSGNWGTVAMTPHPQISKDDAKTMVRYILSIKK